MTGRLRVLVVALRSGERGPRLASSDVEGLPPRDAAVMAARLLHLGCDVRLMDPSAEGLSDRVVRREGRLWRAELVLFHAGGSEIARNPLPELEPLKALVSGWPQDVPRVVAGPLGQLYGAELLARLPDLSGALALGVGPAWSPVSGFDPERIPGLWWRRGDQIVASTAEAVPTPPALVAQRPAWHLLPLSAYANDDGGGLPVSVCGPRDLEGAAWSAELLERVHHAVLRAGASRIVLEDRDLGADPEATRRVARGMFGVAPGVPWSCRVRADHVGPMLALTLAQGGCNSVLVTAPTAHDAAGAAPMDDPGRPAIETAVDAMRVTGVSSVVEHVVGRPGHTVESLSAWHRWYDDRRIAVRPQVRILHAGAKGEGQPTLDEARQRAGCWDNELRPKDVEKAVKSFATHVRPAVGPP